MIMQSSETLTILNRRAELGDPHIVSDNRDLLSIRYALYEPLVRLDELGNPMPVLAVQWGCDEDARTWTIRLRSGVRFHDGSALQAEDVVASLRRVTDNDIGGEMASQDVYQSYLAGARFEALDQETVRITMVEPTADLLDLLSSIVIIPHAFDFGAGVRPAGPARSAWSIIVSAPSPWTRSVRIGAAQHPSNGSVGVANLMVNCASLSCSTARPIWSVG